MDSAFGRQVQQLRSDLFLEIDYLQAANHTHALLELLSSSSRLRQRSQFRRSRRGDRAFNCTSMSVRFMESATSSACHRTRSGVAGNFGDFGGGGNQIPEPAIRSLIMSAELGARPTFSSAQEFQSQPQQHLPVCHCSFIRRMQGRPLTTEAARTRRGAWPELIFCLARRSTGNDGQCSMLGQ